MSQTPKTPMLRLRVAFLAFVLAVVSVLGLGTPSQAAEGCIINVAGIKVCGELLEPLPTVTIKPDPIIIPGPTETVTVRPPAVTVTEPAQPPPPPETVTVEPEPVGPSQMPQETVTEPSETETVTETTTVSPSETGQSSGEGGTIEPENGDEDFFSPNIDFGDSDPTIAEVGIGLLATLALVGLLLLTLWAGYILGYKDKERKDTDFIRALLDSAKPRRH